MVNIDSPKVDIIDWATLAKEDPAAFEERRRQVIEDLISRAPIRLQHRLRCLQWRIDMERERSPNPLAACLRLYSMMWDSILSEGGFLRSLEILTEPNSQGREKQAIKTAQILPFRHKNTIHH